MENTESMMSGNRSQLYRVLSRYELREKYGGILKDRPGFEINSEEVPQVLRPLIPLVEKWGVVEDDWRPLDILRQVAKEELEDLVRTAARYFTTRMDDPFTAWLAGPEAQRNFSDTCLAFSEFQTVFENAEWLLEHWEETHNESD